MRLAAKFMAAGALVASGWLAQDFYTDMKDSKACAAEAWECSSNISRLMGEKQFRIADREEARLRDALAEMGVAATALNPCDETVVSGLALRSAHELIRREIRTRLYDPDDLKPRTQDEMSALAAAEISGAGRGFMCATRGTGPDYFAQARPEFVTKFAAPFNR